MTCLIVASLFMNFKLWMHGTHSRYPFHVLCFSTSFRCSRFINSQKEILVIGLGRRAGAVCSILEILDNAYCKGCTSCQKHFFTCTCQFFTLLIDRNSIEIWYCSIYNWWFDNGPKGLKLDQGYMSEMSKCYFLLLHQILQQLIALIKCIYPVRVRIQHSWDFCWSSSSTSYFN